MLIFSHDKSLSAGALDIAKTSTTCTSEEQVSSPWGDLKEHSCLRMQIGLFGEQKKCSQQNIRGRGPWHDTKRARLRRTLEFLDASVRKRSPPSSDSIRYLGEIVRTEVCLPPKEIRQLCKWSRGA